jgi:hypothetical protein
MKTVFVLRNIANFRHFDEVVRCLSGEGHAVKIVFEQSAKENTTDRALQECLEETDTVEFEFVPKKRVRWWQWRRRARNLIRDWIDYAFYFKPDHPSPTLNWRYKKYLPQPVQWAARVPILKELVVGERTLRFLQKMQQRLPLDPEVVRKLKEYAPDVVLSSPFIKRSVLDVEYIRAAISLKIPSIVAVLSWDNLTSRGTFHALPDAIFLWNEALKREAIELHGLPCERIVVTGAPTFDFWFAIQPQLSRAEFCELVGLDASRPYVVYLGSSWSIAQDEREFVQEFVQALAAEPSTQGVQVLMRPHPLNAKVWEDFERENVRIWPREGQWPDSLDSRQEYYETLRHSVAVMGVNTSAFLDAAVMDKPCVTAVTKQYRGTQSGRGHFAHLVQGDFIEMAQSLESAAVVIGGIVAGADAKAAQRRAFVESFLRPHGLQHNASQVFAQAVKHIAEREAPLSFQPETTSVSEPQRFTGSSSLQPASMTR